MKQDSIQNIIESSQSFYTWNQSSIDSLLLVKDTLHRKKEITETLFQNPVAVVNEVSYFNSSIDWVAYSLFGLLLVIALIWYFIPERFAGIFTFPSNISSKRVKESAFTSPGFLISSILFINYLVTFSLFIFFTLEYFFSELLSDYPFLLLILYISILVFILYFFRMIFIRTNGFFFNTKFLSKQQQLLYTNIDNLMGLILIPVLLLIMYANQEFFILLGIFIVLIVHLFKWIQSFILGKSIVGFSLFHLFMYLCTLEIIPFMVLIKLLENSFV